MEFQAFASAIASAQYNLENEMGTSVKPPKLMVLDEYEGWQEKFMYWVQAMYFQSWVSIDKGYTPPRDESENILALDKYSLTQREEYVAEKRMISLIQQSVKEDILILLPEYKTAQDLWYSLKDKYKGSADMIKSKKALITKQFEIFEMIQGETVKQMIERFCHLKVQMRRHGIEKEDKVYVEKLADALPEGEWKTYVTILKESHSWNTIVLSTFINKLEGHEMELMKNAKMKNTNVVQDVGLYFKSGAQNSITGPKIQTAFSANLGYSPQTPQSQTNTQTYASPDQSSGYSSNSSNSSFQSQNSQNN